MLRQLVMPFLVGSCFAGCLITPKDYPLGSTRDDGGARASAGTLGSSHNGGRAGAGGRENAFGGESGAEDPGGSSGGGGRTNTAGGTSGTGGGPDDSAGGDAPASGMGGVRAGAAGTGASTGAGGAAGITGGGIGGAAGATSGTGGTATGGDVGTSGAGGGHAVKRVFVTSETHDGHLRAAGSPSDLSGLDAADSICNAAAASAGLGGSWIAWLSISGLAAIDRVADVAPWYLIDRTTKVFDTHAQLGMPASTLVNMTERGDTITGHAWTGTALSGVAHSARCGEWKSNNQGQLGAWGDIGNAFDWSYKNTDRCNTEAHLYCFEQ